MTVLEAPPRPVPADDLPASHPDTVSAPAGHDAHPAAPRPPGWGPALAAGLAAAAPAALVGGLFDGYAATVVAGLAAVGGALLAGATARSPRPGLWHLAVIPAVIAAAGASALPGAPDALGRLGSLVADAVQTGRAQPPPLPFDPGWRPVLVAAFAALGFAAGWVASGVGRPRLALAAPLPVGALAALALPASAETTAAATAGLVLFAAFAVSHATRADRVAVVAPLRSGLRAAVAVAVVAVAVAGLARVDALFPAPRVDTEPAPRQPAAAPLAQADDRALFEVTGSLGGPWRLGALDVYDGDAWLARPPDLDRLAPLDEQSSRADARTATITVRDLGEQRVLPVPSALVAIELPDGLDAGADPSTGAVVARRAPPAGTSYVVAAAEPPSVAQLAAARPDIAGDDGQLAAPAPPASVAALLDGSPAEPWRRFLALRARLADAFVAAGGGGPVTTSPQRVADLLDGAEGTPYEQAAAEALLARWSGVPARVGYGYAGEAVEDGRRVVRPRHGAYWVEVRLAGWGWVPLLADAAQAAPTGGDEQQLARAGVTPSDEVPVELIIPVRRTNPVLLYQRARGVLAALVPPALLAAAAWLTSPMLTRWLRRRRRLAWAAAGGPRARIAAAYTEWRDVAIDVGIGGRGRSPLGFCDLLAPDGEHEQLAWLATRALYGDLAPTVDDDDARAAEDLARSLRRRLLAAQPIERRVAAHLSRTSLRRPYSTELPAAPTLRRTRRPLPAPTIAGATT